MKPARLLPACLAAALVLLPAAASAQLFRAYLTLDGNDANACTLPAPCRLLPAALAAVADGGEIWMLDSANYNTGPVAIAKSVKILAVPGVLGSVVALGGNAIDIGTAGVKVTLRNLNIAPFNATNANQTGVRMTNGAALALENVHVQDFSGGNGVWVSTSAKVSILDSVFRNYGVGATFSEGAQGNVSGSTFEIGTYAAINAISSIPISTLVTVSRSVLSKSNAGILGEVFSSNAAVRIYVHDSVIEYNNDVGAGAYVAGALTNAVADVTLGKSMVVTSFYCVRSNGAGARAWVNGNTLNNCIYGLYAASSGTIVSSGNNAIGNTGTPLTGVSTVATQ